ncbi:hypothetical protein Poli38472_004794 [Pythium oligandrum]|uniref:BZIP domain-containing protein n=1 Tax=Pythium oligandrum TaxID=41045 RepID=A0A8K1CAW1_PYTOL|nr:hypothetical protein Poli38472_004794 [Pythium oligandrum]|eukprot:TMW59725.1 hypothetical protein Poli38472_004794 [Pythium oligandrum]
MQATSLFDDSAIRTRPFSLDGFPTRTTRERSHGFGFEGFSSRYQPYQSRSSRTRPLYNTDKIDVASHGDYDSPRSSNLRGSFDYHRDQSPSEFDLLDEEDQEEEASNLSKEELRKHKNRLSAARSRQRSRQRMEQLERMVKELSDKNRRLESELRMLTMQQQQKSTPATLPYYH